MAGVRAMTQANVIAGGVRLAKLVAVVGGSVLIGSPSGLFIASGGAAAFSSTSDVQTATVFSSVYLVDSSAVKVLDCSTGAVANLTATDGSLPTGCRLVCNWRSRLVLARPDSAPHLWFMSRVGDPTDWDYAETDPAAAVSGNNARAGTIGDVITALMPADDDVLFVGGDHSLWRMVGDPNAGGSIVPVSEQIGVIGPNAWAQDEKGFIYFVSPQGLYRVDKGGGVQPLADGRVEDYFREIDIATQKVTLCWDRDRGGLWIFRSPTNGSAGTHLFWSEKFGSFWPQASANTDVGPFSALFYDGDTVDDRAMCLGGVSDKIYYVDDAAITDDDTIITSRVYLGPIIPFGLENEGRAVLIDATMGEYPGRGLDISVEWTLKAADDPYQCLNTAAESRTGQWATTADIGRQQPPQCLSVRGRCFVVKLSDASNAFTWTADKVSLRVKYAGKVR